MCAVWQKSLRRALLLDSAVRRHFNIESVAVGDSTWSVSEHCQQWTNMDCLSVDSAADKVYCIKVMMIMVVVSISTSRSRDIPTVLSRLVKPTSRSQEWRDNFNVACLSLLHMLIANWCTYVYRVGHCKTIVNNHLTTSRDNAREK